MPELRSSRSTSHTSTANGPRRTSRRRFLAAVGTASSVAVAGCSGGLPGTDPETLSTTILEDSTDRLAWAFSPNGNDTDRYYAEFQREQPFRLDSGWSALQFHFNASIPLDSDYELDRFTARVHTSPQYRAQTGGVSVLVEPPGQWEQFRTYYRTTAMYRETIFELDDIGARGTIQFPFVLTPSAGKPLPSSLHCAFSVRASDSGFLGKTVSVSDEGQFEFGTGRQQ